MGGVLDPETNAPSRDGNYRYPFRLPSWHTPPNSLLRYVNNGGGGFGDPLEREPERVLIDVRDEYVTIEGAARDYGVVVTGDPENDPEGLVLDRGGDRAAAGVAACSDEEHGNAEGALNGEGRAAGDLQGAHPTARA